MYLNDLIFGLEEILRQIDIDKIAEQPQAVQAPVQSSIKNDSAANHPKIFNDCYPAIPKISRVTFNGNTTIVWFADNSRCIVTCSTSDKYDRKTAIAYAIVKRLFGKVLPTGEVDGNGFGTYLQKIVDAGFDQKLEEKTAAEKKRKAHEAHLARQTAEQQAAFEKRVEERAKQILLERAATDRANQLEDDARKSHSCPCSKAPASGEANDIPDKKFNASSLLESYVRPDKPFSQFTEQEKHDYWNYHNAKRRLEKKSKK